MLKLRFSSFLLASALGLSACGGDSPTISNDAPINRTAVIFSPSTAELPVPSDLQFSSEPARDGTMNAGTDPANPVITGIDALDGNSVLAPFDIAFDAPLNTAQTLSAANFIGSGASVIPNSGQNVFLLPLAYPSGDGLLQANIGGVSVEVPTFEEALAYQTAVAVAAATGDFSGLNALAQATARAEIISLDGGTNNILRITPLKPLKPKTKYLVVLTDIEDSNGLNTISSVAYDFLKGEDTDTTEFASDALLGLRSAIQNWETLAAGYFNFMQSVFDAAGVAATAPSASDIIFSMTFTTGGTTDVLTYIASPETFFDDSLRAGYKKDAIVKLVSGVYSVGGTTTSTTATDIAIAATINGYLTTDSPTNPLYNASIAGAISQDANFATIAADATAAYIMQRAAAEAAIAVNDAGGAISATAVGTIQAILAGAGGAPASAIFPLPAARPTNFYRVDTAETLNPALRAPAMIYQGDITLPYYQGEPTEFDVTPVKTSSWIADATIGGILDPSGSTPPSDMITYRYPFPTKQSDVTVPVLVTTPHEATLAAFGYTKPTDGWPVIIYVHGITTDRSTSLPMANALAFACIALDETGTPTGLSGAPCYATIAIDQPLHGIAPAAGPEGIEGSIVPGLYSVSDTGNTVTTNIGTGPTAGLGERHFDLTADAAANPIPMVYTDGAESGSSGSLFINLTSFTTSRDNLRQMVLDLLNLNASLDSIDLDSDGSANDLDPANVYFIGHSLGTINGFPFVAINNSPQVQTGAFTTQPKVKAAVGLMAGGGIPRILSNSPSFAPSVLGGLAAASDALTQGNSGLESYLSVLQGVLDSVDVMNFAASLSDANASTGILLTEIIGDNTEANPADQTIPNAADISLGTAPLNTTITNTGFVINGFPAPLAGTEPLITQFGAIPTATADDSDGDAAVIVTRFTQGTHGTPASADNLAVFLEIVAETVSFFAVDGRVTGSIISNTDVVEE